MQWFPALEPIARRRWRLVQLTKSGCPPQAVHVALPRSLREYPVCDRWREYALRRIERVEHPAMVVVSASVNYTVIDGGRPLGRDASTRALVAGYARTLARLRAAAGRVVVLTDPPRPPFDIPSCVSAAMRALRRCAFARGPAVQRARATREAVDRLPGVRVVDATNRFCLATLLSRGDRRRARLPQHGPHHRELHADPEPVARTPTPLTDAGVVVRTRGDRARHRSPPHPRRRQRPDAGDAAGVAGPDDRVDRAADDRRRARRARAPVVGGDRVPAGGHGGDAAVREARRPLRPQDRAAGRADPVPRRLGAVRARAGDDRADRVPGHPGARRRRADGERAGGDRRRRAAERARALHGAVRRGVRRVERRRAADRRLPHDAPVVALDLLRQPAARHRRARRARGHAAVGDRACASTRSTTPARCCSRPG